MPEKRIRVAKTQLELDELEDDSTHIYKSNIIERYTLRPNTIPTVDRLCLAEFASYYYKEYKSDSTSNDAQPEVLTDDATELHIQSDSEAPVTNQLPTRIKLLKTNEVMKCRLTKAVVRYHTPNKIKEPEKYFHHHLMLFFPWRMEESLIGSEQTYASKFTEPEVQAIVEANRAIFEPNATAVSQALEELRNNEGNKNIYSFDMLNGEENEDLKLDKKYDESKEEPFNQQEPSHFACKSDSDRASTISCYINSTQRNF